MDRSEPTLAPQWLKSTGSSSNSDEHSNGNLSRNRFLSFSDHDTSWASSSSSSSRRKVSGNGSVGHPRDSYGRSGAYSSFGRSNRDRDRDRDRGRWRDREKDSLLGNGYSEKSDLLMRKRMVDKDTLRPTRSMVSGQKIELLPKRTVSDSSNGGLSKVSFERDFPSLGAEEKHGVSEVGRVSSPRFGMAINSPLVSSSSVNADGWTSALAKVPAVGGVNGKLLPTSLPTSHTSTGLSMAEALIQAPARTHAAPPLTNESDRRKEHALAKLIPVTHSGPKNSALNSSDKSKLKGARNGDFVAPKIGHQSSSQLVNHAHRLPSTRPDMLNTSQAGTLLVLNREKNGISPTNVTLKDGLSVTTASKGVTSHDIIPSASSSHMKNHVNAKLKPYGVVGEKKPHLSQDRNNFFNSIRKQSEPKNGVQCASSSSGTLSVSSALMKPDNQVLEISACEQKKNENINFCEDELEMLEAPVGKEKILLELFGWDENAQESALTEEEIASFCKQHGERLGPDFKRKAGLREFWQNSRCLTRLSLSSSE